MAADLRRMHRDINIPWQPELDELVSSIHEIDQYIRVQETSPVPPNT